MAQTQEFRGTARAKLRLDNGDFAYIYHQTAVVTRKASGHIVLNSGGWLTNTTKTAMNQALNELGAAVRVSQKNRQWFVGDQPFFDGFTI